MKTYEFKKDVIYPLIEEEIARVASRAYSEDGTSLYDSVSLKSRDKATMERHIDDALYAIVSRFSEIAWLGVLETGTETSTETDTDSEDTVAIFFDIPTERTHSEATIAKAIDRYITMYVCGAWMLEVHKLKSEDYGARTTDAINKVERFLYEKFPPKVPIHEPTDDEDPDKDCEIFYVRV